MSDGGLEIAAIVRVRLPLSCCVWKADWARAVSATPEAITTQTANAEKAVASSKRACQARDAAMKQTTYPLFQHCAVEDPQCVTRARHVRERTCDLHDGARVDAWLQKERGDSFSRTPSRESARFGCG